MSCSNCEELRDTIADLQAIAQRAGLDAQVRRALELARTYLDEGDCWDSPRIRACFETCLDAVGTASTLPAPPEAA